MSVNNFNCNNCVNTNNRTGYRCCNNSCATGSCQHHCSGAVGPVGPIGPRGPIGPQGISGPRGAIGPTGAAGAAILDSYNSYAELIAAHATGVKGDAYLVAGRLYVWNDTSNTWEDMGSLIGPTGPTGAAGAAILGSYATLQELINAHPTGTPGDAYLVGGELYVWNGATRSWQNVGSLIGPTGPTGAAGAAILGSYDTLQELINAHPTGTPGDAYLVGGELYVWNADTASWQNMGSLIGPTGPTGAAGAAILGSYATLQELINAHPTGTPGDAYLVSGELYVWNADTASWQNVGSLIGPTGPTGESGADGIIGEITGIVANIADLPTTGVEPGTIFYVEEDGGIYYWDGAVWTLLDVAQGPRGATGPTGPTGPRGGDGLMGPIQGVVASVDDLPETGVEQGDLYYVEGDGLYAWDENAGWTALGMVQGPRGDTGPAGATGPQGDASAAATIIPFASQQAPHVTTNAGGLPTSVALIGFGYMNDAELVVGIDTNDRSFNLTSNANRQVAFSLPFDMKLNSLYITVGNYEAFPIPPSGTLVYPYVQVYAADAGTNSFSPITDAFARPAQGIDPFSAAAGTMRAAFKEGLDIGLRAGTRIAICGMMEITGDTIARAYYLYYTGGVGMSRWVE